MTGLDSWSNSQGLKLCFKLSHVAIQVLWYTLPLQVAQDVNMVQQPHNPRCLSSKVAKWHTGSGRGFPNLLAGRETATELVECYLASRPLEYRSNIRPRSRTLTRATVYRTPFFSGSKSLFLRGSICIRLLPKIQHCSDSSTRLEGARSVQTSGCCLLKIWSLPLEPLSSQVRWRPTFEDTAWMMGGFGSSFVYIDDIILECFCLLLSCTCSICSISSCFDKCNSSLGFLIKSLYMALTCKISFWNSTPSNNASSSVAAAVTALVSLMYLARDAKALTRCRRNHHLKQACGIHQVVMIHQVLWNLDTWLTFWWTNTVTQWWCFLLDWGYLESQSRNKSHNQNKSSSLFGMHGCFRNIGDYRGKTQTWSFFISAYLPNTETLGDHLRNFASANYA